MRRGSEKVRARVCKGGAPGPPSNVKVHRETRRGRRFRGSWSRVGSLSTSLCIPIPQGRCRRGRGRGKGGCRLLRLGDETNSNGQFCKALLQHLLADGITACVPPIV